MATAPRTLAPPAGPPVVVSASGPVEPEVRATAEPERQSAQRLVGLDLARAVAFAGMLLAHFAWSNRESDPGWLAGLDAAADGRAAPLFCVLLGVGAGLLATRGTADGALVRRGLLLLALGLALWPFTEHVYLILPQYGVLLVLVPLLRRLPTRWLLPAALVAFAVPTAAAAFVSDHGLRAASQPSSYGELLDLPAVAGNILWTGGYPLAGWIGFALVGLWICRLDLHRRMVQLQLLAGGLAVAALQPVVAWMASTTTPLPAAAPGHQAPEGLRAFLDGAAHSNRFAWYVLASATAAAVIGACLLLAGADRRSLLRPLALLGQLALTVYVAHLVLGELVVFDWLSAERPPLTTEALLVLAVLVAAVALATAWRSLFRRGPLESVLRAVSG